MPAWLWWTAGALVLLAAVCAAAWVVARLRNVRPPAPTGVEVEPPRTPPVGDDMRFTVYRPRAAAPDHWYTRVAFAHLGAKRAGAPAAEPDPAEEVRRQAVRVLGEREARA